MTVAVPKRLLIDLDGTLTSSPEAILMVRFTWRTMARLRSHGGWARAARALNALKRALERAPEKQGDPREKNSNRAIQALSDELGISREDAFDVIARNATEFLWEERARFKPVPGALPFIEWARTRFPLTLATNPIWLRPEVELRLRWGGMDPNWFEHITTADLMTACKPHGTYYEEVLAQYPGLRPDEALMIGNSPITDLAAARHGIPVFLLSNQSRAERLKSPGLRAPAWTGNFTALQLWLDGESKH
jgi:FMN phosphatase YigB (HAD superfamily)